MQYRFKLRTPKDAESIILIQITHEAKAAKLSTRISVRSSLWDQRAQRCTGNSYEARSVNELLARWNASCSRICRDCDIEAFGVEEAIKRLAIAAGFRAPDTNNLLMPYYEHWATTSTPFKQATKGDAMCYRTLRDYLGPQAAGFTFAEANYTFYKDYLRHLSEVRKFRPNTIGNHIKKLKAVLNAAYKEGLHSNLDYHRFAKPSEDVYNVYLSLDEIQAIRDVQLDYSLEAARDFFILGCRTGLRYSDVARLQPSMIRDGLIYIKQKKTLGDVVIPAHPDVLSIIDKYQGAPRIWESNLNAQIKTVCRIAGITEPITYTQVDNNGEKRTVTREKCMMVSSHTARRSFATNAYLCGLKPIDIMKMTGHRTESSFLKYLKVSREQTAQALRNDPFFK